MLVRTFDFARSNSRKIAGSLILWLAWLLCLTSGFAAQNVILGWSPSPSSIAGYRVYYGVVSGAYTARIEAGTNLTCTVGNLLENTTYYFTATAYDFAGVESLYSTEVVYTVPTSGPPTILAQPLSHTNIAGSTASFTVSVSSPGTVAYQWSKDGVPLAGATSGTLVLANVSPANAGSYAVTVSNPAGSVTSLPATLTVLNPPVITSQPLCSTNLAGASVTFSVAANGTGLLFYQWCKGPTAIVGATSTSLSLANLTASDAGSYCVIVTNLAGSVSSSVATLTILTPPSITSQPASVTNIVETTASFTVGVSGSGPLRYQWYKAGVPQSGATNATLVLANVSAASAGSYSVTASNLAGTVTSAAATLTVIAIPVIVAQPVSLTNVLGTSASFIVQVSSSVPVRYQWFKSGVALGGQTNANLSFTSVVSADAGGYTVSVTNIAGAVTSSTATLVVISPPVITTQPISQTNTVGSRVTLSVAATGSAPLKYQWYKSGLALGGATNSSLIFASVALTNAGSYTVSVSNPAGSATSAAAVLGVIASANSNKGGNKKTPMSLAITGTPNHWYELQASTNLMDWAAIWRSDVVTDISQLQFQDQEDGFACRFYRWIEH